MFEGDSSMWTLWNGCSKGGATKPTIPPKKEPAQLIKVSIYIAVTGGSPIELEVALSPEHNPDTSAVYADFENWFKAETRKTGKYRYSPAPATFTFEGKSFKYVVCRDAIAYYNITVTLPKGT